MLRPAITFVLLWCSAFVHADVLELSHGGRVEGEIVNLDRAEDEPYVIRTQFGLITVSHDDVARVRVPSEEQKKYNFWLDKMPATADGNWKMAEWCQQNGLSDERELHLREVIRLDPEHGDARQALGYVRRDGEWVTRNDIMQQRGFIRHRGRWRLPQEIELDEAREKQDASVREWRTKIKRWRNWIGRRREEEAVAIHRCGVGKAGEIDGDHSFAARSAEESSWLYSDRLPSMGRSRSASDPSSESVATPTFRTTAK